MKFRIFLICMALSSAAWGAEPAANSAATADTAAPAAADTQTAPAAPAEQTAPAANPTEQQAAPADTSAQKKSSDAQSGFSRGSVVRSQFTSAVKDREPVDKLNNGKTHDNRVYFFTELRDMSGQTAVHRWQYNGKVVAEVKFKVRGPRWRVWSSKTFSPNATGEWKVSVLNGAGEVIAENMIDYAGPAPAQQPAAETPATTDNPDAMEKPATAEPATGEQTPAQQPATDAMPK